MFREWYIDIKQRIGSWLPAWYTFAQRRTDMPTIDRLLSGANAVDAEQAGPGKGRNLAQLTRSGWS